jgi:2-succinyl-6-hydroxy-2,4-cyclohexadiene-1-carboxylate synthase
MAVTPPPLLLLHGFTQTHASWAPVRRALPADREVLAPDAPGHGEASGLRLDLAGAATRAAALLDGRRAIVVGYSMGGRTALRLALDHPDAVAGLVLLGATAGIDDPEERAARRAADAALADAIERDGVEPFVERWLAQPLFAGLQADPADLVARRANTADGLASSLRLAGTGTMDPPWWRELVRIDVPTLVLWGERDGKFAALGRRLVEAIGAHAEGRAIAGAGHAAHLSHPDAVAAAIGTLAARLDPPG